MSRRSIGFRLTAWYFAVLAVTLSVLGGGVWYAMRQSIHSAVDEELESHLKGVRRLLERHLPRRSLEEVRREFREHSGFKPGGDLVQVSDQQGNWVYQSASIRDYQLPMALPDPAPNVVRYETIPARGVPLRVLFTTVQVEGRPYGVQIAAPLDEFYEVLDRFGWLLLSSFPAVLILASLGGYWMSQRAVSPVDEITNTARSISLQNLARRLPVHPTGDALERLSVTLNQMLERLESAFHRIIEFTADASHELRTPVALMRTTAELSLKKERSAAEYREALAQILAELERTSQLIESLMTLARADSGAEVLRIEPADLTKTLGETCAQGRTLAQAKHVGFESWVPDKPVQVQADTQALRRLFLILIDNAIKYTPAGGDVAVSLHSEDGWAIVEIRDTGIGIAPEDLPNIFDRFYRADKARSRETGGTGLGLSIARWIAEAHRGEIQVESAPGQGSTFRFSLPLDCG